MNALGIDPGGAETGIVLRSGDDVRAVEVLVRPPGLTKPDSAYLNRILDVVAALSGSEVAVIGVEDVNVPTGFVAGQRAGRPLAVSLMGTCMVLGAVLSTYPEAVLVPPGHHGGRAVRGYPPALVGGPHNPRFPRPEPKGAGTLRHARSAYDIAGAARFQYRAVAAGRG